MVATVNVSEIPNTPEMLINSIGILFIVALICFTFFCCYKLFAK